MPRTQHPPARPARAPSAHPGSSARRRPGGPGGGGRPRRRPGPGPGPRRAGSSGSWGEGGVGEEGDERDKRGGLKKTGRLVVAQQAAPPVAGNTRTHAQPASRSCGTPLSIQPPRPRATHLRRTHSLRALQLLLTRWMLNTRTSGGRCALMAAATAWPSGSSSNAVAGTWAWGGGQWMAGGEPGPWTAADEQRPPFVQQQGRTAPKAAGCHHAVATKPGSAPPCAGPPPWPRCARSCRCGCCGSTPPASLVVPEGTGSVADEHVPRQPHQSASRPPARRPSSRCPLGQSSGQQARPAGARTAARPPTRARLPRLASRMPPAA